MAKRTKTYIIKTYKKRDLLSTWSIVKERISLIEMLSNQLKHLPETKFQIYDKEIIYNQQFKHKFKTKELTLNHKKKLLVDLSITLDKMEEEGFVHGDLNRKNIIFSEKQLWIIDLEPDLKQIKEGREALMITRPYFSKEDIEKNKITSRTDKIAWYAFIMRMINDSFYKNNNELYDDVYQTFRPSNFHKLSFNTITDKILK